MLKEFRIYLAQVLIKEIWKLSSMARTYGVNTVTGNGEPEDAGSVRKGVCIARTHAPKSVGFILLLATLSNFFSMESRNGS